MRELIGKVAISDGTTASALQVIAHFDVLADQRASVGSILRAAAALADCPVVLHRGAIGSTVRVDPAGRTLSDDPPDAPDETVHREMVDRHESADLWLERTGTAGSLDQLILERAAQALRPLLRSAATLPDRQAAVRIACDPLTSEADRRAALRARGVTGEALVVVTPPDQPPKSGSAVELRSRWVLLLPAHSGVDEHIARSSRAGIAKTRDLDIVEALRRATRALALTVEGESGGPVQVDYDDLGDIVDLAQLLPPGTDTPDAGRLEELRRRRPWVPGTIYQVLGQPSMRRAATALHIHHSTLQHRLAWLESELGYRLDNPAGRLRAATAWTLWRCAAAPATRVITQDSVE